jgi:hypothetical protein
MGQPKSTAPAMSIESKVILKNKAASAKENGIQAALQRLRPS